MLIGAALTSSEAVRKTSFTGSTRVGNLLLEQAARTVKRTSMELGGNAQLIVFNDADIKAAVVECMNSKFRNVGQTCVCVNRIYVKSGIYDAFTAALRDAVQLLKVGYGTGEDITIGPLINSAAAVEKVERHIADALKKGRDHDRRRSSSRLGPNTLPANDSRRRNRRDGASKGQDLWPRCVAVPFETEAEAIQLANATSYGLAAYVFTRDLDRMWRVTDAIETGMIGVNEGPISNKVAPFGSIKESGLGREGSRYRTNEYLEQKYVMISPNLDTQGLSS